MPQISQPTQKLIQRYQGWQKASQLKEGEATLHVDEVASRVAFFYEKLREVIDWREEHLLRKTAIERTLKRRLFLRKDGEIIAEPLTQELIRGGHFPNDSIPESKIIEIKNLIDKYIFILDNAPSPPEEKMELQLSNWLLGIAACELEETLAPPFREKDLIDFMLELMKERIEIRDSSFVSRKMPEEEKNIQIYIAIQRALFKLDPPIISYHLLRQSYLDWKNLPPEKMSEIAKNIYLIWERLEKSLNHPLAEKFYNVCERYDTPYLLLGDIISKDPTAAESDLENPEVFEKKIGEAYRDRLKRLKGVLKRAAIYSTTSIFLTKILLAFAIEINFDKYVTGQFSYFTSGINILLPPLLMAFLVLNIRPPSKRNEQLVVMETMKIVYERNKKDIYEIRPAPKRGLILNSVIIAIYFFSFVLSFGLMTWGLRKLNFSFLSIIIFLMFVSLISFAGTKIRQRARELEVEREKETFFHTFLDLFSLPILRVGRWLSTQWVKYNALAILFNSLLDLPFQVFVEFLEQWRSFSKEKKEEI